MLALALGASVLPIGAGAANGSIGTEITQCANDPSGIGDCTGSAWITGALNPTKSGYKGGDFVPFRTQIINLTAGKTYTLRIGYDAVEDDLHAYDYLGSVDGSETAVGQEVVPCDNIAGTTGVHACGSAPSTVPVPTDTNTSFPRGDQAAGSFSAWGGTLKDAAYVSPQPIDVSTSKTVERQIDVTFTAEGDTVVLAWGGHIASMLDWGSGETYVGNGSGAPFHMRLKQIQESGAPVTSTGNQDLAIQASAIKPVPSPFDTTVAPQSVFVGATVVDTTTLAAKATGAVDFYVCFDSNSTPDCSSGGVAAALAQVVAFTSDTSSGTATSPFVPDQPGHYCFRAEYEPGSLAPFSPGIHTNTTTECFEAALPPPTLTVKKICVPPDNGRFDLTIDGTAALSDAACGGSTGAVVVKAGTHKVGEAAGTGTKLTDYTTTIGGPCGGDGTITLAAGDAVTCTITNVRKSTPPPATATLKVTKVCKPSGDDKFDLFIDITRFRDVSCGGSTDAVTLPTGDHTVREAAGTATDLGNYTSVIGGDCNADGSITLKANDTAVCTIANTRKQQPPTTLTVNKLCEPPQDTGTFDLRIDSSSVVKGSVGCGGTSGPIKVSPGLHDVSEAGAGNTDLGDYDTLIGGDCNLSGEVSVEAGQAATCQITNVHKQSQPAPFATLTVNKICVPSDDGGRFDLEIDDQSAQDQSCGGRIGPLVVPAGVHHVGEAAGTDTKLTDYTTTIGGACAADGSVTLRGGDITVCTITNVHLVVPLQPATITVDKLCVPTGDSGKFDLRIDADVAKKAAACGGTTGPTEVTPGQHHVSESGAGTTDLGDYDSVIGGDCNNRGEVTVKVGESATCQITNVRKQPSPPPSATLTLRKICVPATDGGSFDLQIDNQSAEEASCGGRIGPLVLPIGAHHVGEAAGAGTSLTDYTSATGGDCAADGSITLKAGDTAVCTITNTRTTPSPPPTTTTSPAAPEEPTATVTVTTVCIPANQQARFEVDLDDQSYPGLACADTTGPIVISAGVHVVGDVVTPAADPSTYRTVYRGSCSRTGKIQLSARTHKRCVVVHIRRPHATSPSPPNACYTLVVSPRLVKAGSRGPIVALVAIRGNPVPGVEVEMSGPGISRGIVTPESGRASFRLEFVRPGFIVLRTRRQYGCPHAAAGRLGVMATRTPPVTG